MVKQPNLTEFGNLKIQSLGRDNTKLNMKLNKEHDIGVFSCLIRGGKYEKTLLCFDFNIIFYGIRSGILQLLNLKVWIFNMH